MLTSRSGVVALAILAIAEAVVIARLLTADRVAPSVASAEVTIESTRAGDLVVVDGREVGVTPYRLTVDSSVRSIGLVSPARPQGAAGAATPAETAHASMGGLRLTSPIDLDVLDGERVLGSSADGLVAVAAGIQQLDLLNNRLGYRERVTVEIEAGQVRTLEVKPPDGHLNITTVPPAQVWIDGKQAGSTPIEHVTLPVGQHEIVFRRPQRTDQREVVVVKAGALARVSVTLSP